MAGMGSHLVCLGTDACHVVEAGMTLLETDIPVLTSALSGFALRSYSHTDQDLSGTVSGVSRLFRCQRSPVYPLRPGSGPIGDRVRRVSMSP